MPRKGYISVRVEPHEREMMRADAEHYGVDLSRYLALVWRNWRFLGAPLRALPQFPVDPYIPKAQRTR